MQPDVSVVISNRNDTAMLAVTVKECLEQFRELPVGGEVIIVDNSDKETYEELRKGFFIPRAYYGHGVALYRQDFSCLFTARDTAVRKATGRYVLCIDGHMLLGNRMIADMVAFMDSKLTDDTVGFGHAPICWLHHHERTSKHDRDLETSELGPWGQAYNHERTITWKGMPWICRREWFFEGLGAYGALSEHKISWGGGDMYIGTKPWLLGYKNWAIPCRPGFHIGPFAVQVRKKHKYRLYSHSGAEPSGFGFLLACFVLGGEAMMERNKSFIDDKYKKYGCDPNDKKLWNRAIALGRRDREWLLKRQVMSYEEYLAKKPWEETNADQ